MNWRNHITSNPDILFGKPVIVNTRIPVDLLLEKLSHGESIEELRKEYPHLTHAHIYAALAYAAEYIKGEMAFESTK